VSQPNQTGDRLKVPLCTREYPPEVYGGAGVHVEYMANELSEHVDLTAHCHRGPTGRPRWRTGHGTT
jgi:starch synthase